ncbi:programmed cell death protein 2-like isoform X1 [Mytilus californianus]|uniref:programmed cell death protein 2-like isoform X1 n=1 Tax=Mytilus californianus TaxID=6549 RepID=UPI002247EADA|nr:programmed cell death protein 2-like isoform X1 [Mytilus californianus]
MTTFVLLGIIDEPCSSLQINWSSNKIGGHPDWIIPQTSPSCSECNKPMVLVVQLYCPLDGSVYHRTLYAFTCVNCKGNKWTVIRQQTQSKIESKAIAKKVSSTKIDNDLGVKTDDWGTDMDDWGVETDNWGTDAKDWGGESNLNGLSDNTLDTEQVDSKNTESFADKSNEECLRSNMNYDPQLVTCSDLNIPSKSSFLANNTGSMNNDEEELVTGLSNIEVDGTENSMNVIVEDDMVDTDRLNEVMSVIKETANSHVNPLPSQLCLLSFYVSVLEEPEDSLDSAEEKHIKQLLKSYESEQGAVDDEVQARGNTGSSAGEKYEKATHVDNYFHKFSKRIGRYPSQIIRYNWNGSPLYISKPDTNLFKASQGKCHSCGSELVYEFQIMPGLITKLSFNKKKGTGIEYGTVVIYTCKASCWTESNNCHTEHVFIQSDPDQHLLK